jgi:hypothetical protein
MAVFKALLLVKEDRSYWLITEMIKGCSLVEKYGHEDHWERVIVGKILMQGGSESRIRQIWCAYGKLNRAENSKGAPRSVSIIRRYYWVC